MADYSDGAPDWRDTPGYQEAMDRRDELWEFWGREGKNQDCPRCGAHVEWGWTDATNAIRHMEWHKKLASLIKSSNSPFGGLMFGDPEI